MAGDRHGKHNTTTISFRVNSYEKATIEERVKVSGMKKQDYIVRSCIYNQVCVVGKKETIEIIRSEMKEMSLVLEDVAKDLKSEKPVISEPVLDSMTERYLAFLEAALWMLKGSSYLWEDKRMEEKVMKDCKVLALCSQKGGVGKTTSCVNLAVGLAKAGKKVLVIDNDPQGSMTASLGYHNPDELPITLATILTKIVEDELFENTLGILHHQEGIDLIPANIELSGMEVSLVNIMSRELVLKQYIERMREEYDYILIDCMPSLGMLTINALASVDAVIIPVQAAYLPVKGLEQLIRTIGKVRRQLNKQLKIGGILITMVDNRTNYARDISDLIFDTYGNQIKIFPQSIPFSVRAAEISAEGISIFEHDPKGKVAAAYWQMTQEVLLDER